MPNEQKDKCRFCRGTKGGMPGNENVIGGVVVCDYCTSLLIDIKKVGWLGEQDERQHVIDGKEKDYIEAVEQRDGAAAIIERVRKLCEAKRAEHKALIEDPWSTLTSHDDHHADGEYAFAGEVLNALQGKP